MFTVFSSRSSLFGYLDSVILTSLGGAFSIRPIILFLGGFKCLKLVKNVITEHQIIQHGSCSTSFHKRGKFTSAIPCNDIIACFVSFSF